MRILFLILVGIFTLVFQSTLGHLLQVSGVQPDFILIFVVWTALRMGSVAGVMTGFFMGVILDIYAWNTLGAQAMAFSIVGYIAGFAEQRFVSLDLVTKVLILAGTFILHDLLHSISVHLNQDAIIQVLLFKTVPEGIYTLIFGAIIFYLFRNSRDMNEL